MIVSASPDWQTANQQYLSAALMEVHGALQQYIVRVQGNGAIASEPAAIPDMAAMAAHLSPPPALLNLCTAFNLTSFERNLLLLCAGVELSALIAQLCAVAQETQQQAYPTFSLALATLPEAHWSALTPVRPLRHWRLIEVSHGESLTQSRLRIDERVLHYLNGISYLDDRLRALVQPLSMDAQLPRSHYELAERMANLWSCPSPPPIIQLCGDERDGKLAVAAAACAMVGIQLHSLRAEDIPTSVAERDALARLWEREAILSQSALLLECNESERVAPQIIPFLETVRGMFIVAGREPLSIRQHSSLRLNVNQPTPAEQRYLWQTCLSALSPELNGNLERVVSHFNLSYPNIHSICSTLTTETPNPHSLGEMLWETCRTQCRTQLDNLAQRIQSVATWDDLVLPQSQQQTLREIAAQVRQRSKVYEAWEFSLRGSNGLGISALFAGASGTGKTMAAEVLAQELKLDLYRIDLSQVVSKYIGETEKNLRRVFDAAETGGAILLFDEADALFGKRSEVKDSHDRYANIEVSYLLQRMEAYRGLAILTTNLRSAIDVAFLRRIRFMVQFPFPDIDQRIEIWRRMFPSKMPTQGLNLPKLAQLNLAGGNIRNIALNAAFLAADAGEAVQMKHLLRAAQSEYVKLERTLTEVEVSGWI